MISNQALCVTVVIYTVATHSAALHIHKVLSFGATDRNKVKYIYILKMMCILR